MLGLLITTNVKGATLTDAEYARLKLVFSDLRIATMSDETAQEYLTYDLENNKKVSKYYKVTETTNGTTTSEVTKEEATKKANEFLKKINLLDKKDSYPDELSGGEKQRIAIVRALLMEPDLMLFDEPTSALDPEMIGEVTDLMREIALGGMTMIVVSHEMNFIKNFTTKVIFMDDGKIIEENTPEELFNNPKDKRLKEFLSKVNEN